MRSHVVLRLSEGPSARRALGFTDVFDGLGALVGCHTQLSLCDCVVVLSSRTKMWRRGSGRGVVKDVRMRALIIQCVQEDEDNALT